GIAGQVLGQERREQAAGGIAAAAGRRADDHGDGLAAERQRILGGRRRAGDGQRDKGRRQGRQLPHARSPCTERNRPMLYRRDAPTEAPSVPPPPHLPPTPPPPPPAP